MANKTQILNMALGHIGVTKEVANIDTEKSEAAALGRRFYDTAVNLTTRDARWPFLMKIATLALIEEEPNTEWGYSYAIPSDCKAARRILSGIRNDTRQTRAPYRLARGTSGPILFTDEEDAELEYTSKADDSSLFPDDFTLAVSYMLGSLIAPGLTAGDKHKRGAMCLNLYATVLSRAEANAFNEEQEEEVPDSEFINARD